MKKLLVLFGLLFSTVAFSQNITLKEAAQQNDQWGDYSYYPYNIVCMDVNVEPGALTLEHYRQTMEIFIDVYHLPYEYDGTAEINWAIVNHPIDTALFNRHKFDYSIVLEIDHQDNEHALFKFDDPIIHIDSVENEVQDFSNPKIDKEWLPEEEVGTGI